MKLRKLLSVGILMFLILLGYGFNSYSETEVEPKIQLAKIPLSLQLGVLDKSIGPDTPNPQPLAKDHKDSGAPLVGQKYTGFKEAVGFKESRGNYGSINTLGYMGKYQFGSGTLALLGIRDSIKFLHSAELQETVFAANLARNKWVLRREIKNFSGTNINGILITESGLLAAAHLAGPGNVKKYLRTQGTAVVKDAYGTSIEDYLSLFGGYDLSLVKARKSIKINGDPFFRVS
ncbi:MAG: hypothetical protein HKO11_11095 [Eudoraea sp.]|nr:hypothetical protein [Eudoraea sp.]